MAEPEVHRETRERYRKKVTLLGGYIKKESDLMGDMIVEDLSFTGLSFVTMSEHSLEIGDTLRLKFRLDDPTMTEISRNGVVRYIQGRTVGVEFVSSASLDWALGFYLLV
jgi:hypothetical protein